MQTRLEIRGGRPVIVYDPTTGYRPDRIAADIAKLSALLADAARQYDELGTRRPLTAQEIAVLSQLAAECAALEGAIEDLNDRIREAA